MFNTFSSFLIELFVFMVRFNVKYLKIVNNCIFRSNNTVLVEMSHLSKELCQPQLSRSRKGVFQPKCPCKCLLFSWTKWQHNDWQVYQYQHCSQQCQHTCVLLQQHCSKRVNSGRNLIRSNQIRSNLIASKINGAGVSS